MTPPLADLHATRSAIALGQTSAPEELDKSIAIAQGPACAHAFIQTHLEAPRKTVAAAQGLPLAGLAVSIKDLFDIAGDVTAAGSIVLADAPRATADAPAVARLRAAGGAIIGRTNMTEFAFSGVGVNPHYGTPAAVTGMQSDTTPRIPGGSSSGAAVSVASGAAFIGLGSDTGGSIRVPAALNGLVGFKNTARLVPTDGALPLSTTLDTVCAMTRSVRDAILAHEILSHRKVVISARPLSARRFAVARTLMQDDLEQPVAQAFERALKSLRDAGAQIQEVGLSELDTLASLQSTGGFSAAESFTWHRALLARSGEQYDPRVRRRIERGADMSAADYIDLMQGRAAWMKAMETALAGFDAVLSPTVPIVAPPIDAVAPGSARDAEFFRINGLLLRNPSVVNMLDGCAISLPCHPRGDWPCGLMLWHGALHDDELLAMALQAEPLLQSA